MVGDRPNKADGRRQSAGCQRSSGGDYGTVGSSCRGFETCTFSVYKESPELGVSTIGSC